jgi:uncharacterized C2H2 Zn-finger protein
MTHTWPLHLSYARCPNCHYIFESRQDYAYRMGEYSKELTCPKCKKTFKASKQKPDPVGPLFGESPQPEFTWE